MLRRWRLSGWEPSNLSSVVQCAISCGEKLPVRDPKFVVRKSSFALLLRLSRDALSPLSPPALSANEQRDAASAQRDSNSRFNSRISRPVRNDATGGSGCLSDQDRASDSGRRYPSVESTLCADRPPFPRFNGRELKWSGWITQSRLEYSTTRVGVLS